MSNPALPDTSQMSESEFADFITESHAGFTDTQMQTVRVWGIAIAGHAREKGWKQGWSDAAASPSEIEEAGAILRRSSIPPRDQDFILGLIEKEPTL